MKILASIALFIASTERMLSAMNGGSFSLIVNGSITNLAWIDYAAAFGWFIALLFFVFLYKVEKNKL